MGKNGDLVYAKWDAGVDSEPESNTMVWGSSDWFTQRLHYSEGNLVGRSIRMGVVFPEYWKATTGGADEDGTAPGPVGTIASFSFEVQRRETTR